jgi:hypothetical protein
VLLGQLSHRRRRLLFVLLALFVAAGGIAAAIVELPTGTKLDRSSVSHPPPGQYRSELPQRSRRLSAAERRQLLSSVFLFVTAAVTRNHPERSWPIVDSSLREGLTRRQWITGNIPVVPFPAVAVGPLRVTSVVGTKAMVEIVLVPTRRSHLVRKTFLMELREQSRRPHRWAVSSWVPEGISYSLASRKPVSPVGDASNHTLSSIWIAVPIGFLLAGLLLLPAGVFVREAYRSRRAEAEARGSRS